MKKVDVLGVQIDPVTWEEALNRFGGLLDSGKKFQVAKINAEILMHAQRDAKFRTILNSSKLVVSDGVGPMWAARFLAMKPKFAYKRRWALKILTKLLASFIYFFQMIFSLLAIIVWPRYIKKIIPARVGGANLMADMVCICDRKALSVFLLGGEKGIPEKAIESLKEKCRNLKVAGFYDGKVDFSMSHEIVRQINDSGTDVLFVAFGAPKQETWIKDHLNQLHIKTAIGEGGSFDYIAGKIKRAPVWMQKAGLEWFWRFLLQPQRIGRILTAVPKFMVTVFRYKLRND